MIERAVIYKLRCDGCQRLCGDQSMIYQNRDALEQEAEFNNWRQINRKWYCPDCYGVNPETDEYEPMYPETEHFLNNSN